MSILRKIFGANHRNSEKSVANISDELLDKALTSGNQAFIINYLQNGGDINRKMKVVVNGMSEGIAYNEEVECYSLDRVSDENLRDFMRKNGAVTYQEDFDMICEMMIKILSK